jgi:hypothetical protein
MEANVQELVRYHEISQFLYKEARLQDEHRYAEWEALWTDDAVYWVPANGEDTDPEQEMSIIYDNRSRIGLRIRQFFTGKRFSQSPQSRLRRVIANVEVLGDEERGTKVAPTCCCLRPAAAATWSGARAMSTCCAQRPVGAWRARRWRWSTTNAALMTMAFLM